MLSSTDLLVKLGTADRIWHLGRAPLLRGLEPSEIQTLSETVHDAIYAEGASIYQAGEPADRFFFLNRGTVRLSVTCDENREKTLEFLRGGDVFGLETLAEGCQYDVRAVAHEESWVSILARSDYLSLARRRSSLAFNLAQILLQSLSRAHADIRALCFLDIEQRLVVALLTLASRHGQRLNGQPNLVRLRLRLSHDYLARLTGANRPYLSNIMSEMKKKGWIQYERQHLLLDVQALSAAAGTSQGAGPLRISDPSSRQHDNIRSA